jgi:hypothetical protein
MLVGNQTSNVTISWGDGSKVRWRDATCCWLMATWCLTYWPNDVWPIDFLVKWCLTNLLKFYEFQSGLVLLFVLFTSNFVGFHLKTVSSRMCKHPLTQPKKSYMNFNPGDGFQSGHFAGGSAGLPGHRKNVNIVRFLKLRLHGRFYRVLTVKSQIRLFMNQDTPSGGKAQYSWPPNGTVYLKNVNNSLNTNIYSYLETSGGRSSNLYLNFILFLNTSVN